jgi:hypothetical protein
MPVMPELSEPMPELEPAELEPAAPLEEPRSRSVVPDEPERLDDEPVPLDPDPEPDWAIRVKGSANAAKNTRELRMIFITMMVLIFYGAVICGTAVEFELTISRRGRAAMGELPMNALRRNPMEALGKMTLEQTPHGGRM